MDDPLTRETLRSTPGRAYDSVATSIVVLGLILAAVSLRILFAAEPREPLPPAVNAIDPNTAPWWELTALPDIGEGTARKIVEYRQAHADRSPVFRRPDDLEPVPGIGPKTIERISPHLRFND
ncbi:MAG: helix-hairpin-helix domain-containing protein [Planctomycetota bacterium]